ncbi:class I SAM-dependent methyltransferase [Mesonia aquimarina]|uniref:class I SAM-dependent methyltransferase n=1 Tax=Mesonia aquimarina TaxID=1504967 RepID=UPI000EF623B6|nr:class I SAM-dependent methyltransferase [Mesonia aquimarina]
MTKLETNWYASWFDTDFYHILYRDRGYQEAQDFMQNLVDFLQLEKKAKLLDLACGKGRHSIYLHKLGYNVTGVDLSKNSIAEAKTHEKQGLDFQVHDMCKPLPEKFDAVFNLFTSFGYFEKEESNLNTIKAIKQELKPNGFGVIDFMNVEKVITNLVPEETKSVKGIDFNISRWVENGFIFKRIQFEAEGDQHDYIERVKALRLEDFKDYFKKAGINLKHTLGDYDLHEFDEKKSDRLILIFQ